MLRHRTVIAIDARKSCPLWCPSEDTPHPCETTGPNMEAVPGSEPNVHERSWLWTL